jgi:hypothetical protein
MAQNLVPTSKTAQITALLDDGNAKASATLTVGSILWKVLAYSEHLDFLLSLREEKFSMIFTFFEDAGWWILAGIGILWFFATRIKENTLPQPLNWAFVLSCTVIAFLFGSLVTVKSSGEVPTVIVGWGGDATSCNSVVDMSKLQSFRDKYKLYLICGFTDPTIDMLEDQRILISNPFDIRPGGVQIVANYSKHMDELKQIPAGTTLAEWHHAVLVPNEISRDKISTLADVVALGGKILTPGLYR